MKSGGWKVLVAEPIEGSELTYDYLREGGCELILGPDVSHSTKGYSEEELVKLFGEVDAFFGMSREKLPARVLEKASRLKVICKYGMGVDHIDVKTATEKGILVTNAPVHNLTVAEFAIGGMLAIYKKIVRNERYIRQGGWRDDAAAGNELYGKNIGLLGFGAIGRQVAKRLQGWDVNLLVYDPFVSRDVVDSFGGKLVDQETLFKTADIVSIHVPLNAQTTGIVGRNEFSMMKPTAILINTSRAKVVNQADLIEALQQKKIAGAAIDVWETEPVDLTHPLLNLDNVIVSPHVAGFTPEALRRIAQQAAKNCLQALKGEKPDFVVNPDVLDKWRARVNQGTI